MDPAPSPHPPPPAHPPTAPPLVAAWPRSAQLTTAFLLGLSTALLLVHVSSSWRWGSRPTEQERGAVLAYRIDLNRADRAELLQVPGIGPNLADNIESYRRDHGDFRRVDDLIHVHGIGPAAMERMRSWVCVRIEGEEEQGSPATEQRPRASKKSKSAKAGGSTPAKKTAKLTGLVNINQATQEELQSLPGVGSITAQRIIEERQKGTFKSVDDLRRVSGIGPAKLERLRPFAKVTNDSGQVAAAD